MNKRQAKIIGLAYAVGILTGALPGPIQDDDTDADAERLNQEYERILDSLQHRLDRLTDVP